MLLVLLALLRDVDNEVTENTGVTAKPTTVLEAVLRLLQQLGRGQLGEMLEA